MNYELYISLTSPPPLLMIKPDRETASDRFRRKKKGRDHMKYECPCGYIYDPEVGDPEGGIAPGTAWEDVPEDWVCPVCGLGKDAFTPV